MKKYRVNVNGSLYEIEIEEMAAPAKMSAAAPAAVAPAASAPAPAARGPLLPPQLRLRLLLPLPPPLPLLPVQALRSRLRCPAPFWMSRFRPVSP